MMTKLHFWIKDMSEIGGRRLSKLSVAVTLLALLFCLTYGFGFQKKKTKVGKSDIKAFSRRNSISIDQYKELSRFADLDRTKRIFEHDDLNGQSTLDSIRGAGMSSEY
jgi:hypothetical protein